MEPTKRFSDKVEHYIKYRPSYPSSLISLLEEKIGLTTDWQIADIGAGPGNLAELFVKNGNYVYGIEPNDAMFNALMKQMKEYSNFSARPTAAEDTRLESNSIDLITCGQSFHWFDLKKTRSEFEDILKENGWVSLIWNNRRKDNAFGAVYEQLLQTYSIDYKKVDKSRLEDADFDYFFDSWDRAILSNVQYFKFDELMGRYQSSSYALTPDHDDYDDMEAELHNIFNKHETDGKIEFAYETETIYGQF